MTIFYLTLDQAVQLHRATVEVSGGGTLGHLDLGRLESVLQHIQNDDYYPTLAKKLTHLFYSACKFHCFADGNKRIAITLCHQMLSWNGYLRSIRSFSQEAENISYHVARGCISKELLHDWFAAVLCDTLEEDESLKLKILQAISGETDETAF